MNKDPDFHDQLAKRMAIHYRPSNIRGIYADSPGRDSSFEPVPKDDTNAPAQNLTELLRQNQILQQQLNESQALNQKLLSLNDFGRELNSAPDGELTAQSMAKNLLHLVHCQLVCIFSYQQVEQRFKLLACSGPAAQYVPGSFQPDQGIPVIRQALHSQQLSSSRDLPVPGAPLFLGRQRFASLLAAPLARRGIRYGLILLASSDEQAFSATDASVVESAAALLLRAWEYAHQNDTLTRFIQNVMMMSIVQEASSLLEMIAAIARQTLNASYILVATLNQQEWLMRDAGKAPQLFRSLQNGGLAFMEEAMKSPYTFRLRDLRSDERTSALQLDSVELCSLLASPIRINGTTTGLLLAFGKNNDIGFSDLDVFLAELLVSQTAVNLESCSLNQELRVNLKTTQLLYDLSLSISQAEDLNDAARAIGRTAYRLLQARKCGLILFSTDGWTEAEVRFPAEDHSFSHPFSLIQQAMDSRQTIYLSESQGIARIVIPIQTLRRCYGALWVEIDQENEESRHPTEEIRILINQAAVALERSILLEETRHQANEITRAYRRLDNSYDLLLVGLTRALDARDRETEGHSERVREISVNLGIDIGLSKSELKALERGALLHDIGKIGISDMILLKNGPLDKAEWQEMHKHPKIGAEIVQDIPPLRDALEVIAFHQERWDGSGYPARLRGKDIPLLARIFAVVDVYDALTSNRPYRKALSLEEALEYLESQAGIHFDPDVVNRFVKLVRDRKVNGRA